MSDTDRPFRTLGWQLKLAREQLGRTLSEVSGAVEIETEILEQIEQGKKRPNEDLLYLLISYFDIKDNEATSLWDLAGYSDSLLLSREEVTHINAQDKSVGWSIPIDPRIFYTDHVHVTVNQYGVVMNFMQSAGYSNQSLPVSRVGMSRDHAHKVIELLQQSLDETDKPKHPKLLPRIKNSSKTKPSDTTDTN
jgi:transcriptional regulator with XRE-family HTH domain